MTELRTVRIKERRYEPIHAAMTAFTGTRREQGWEDELWLVEHDAVFTLGQAGKPEHILDAGDVPVVQSDRGGQVTYHGPGQLVIYTMIDLRARALGVRDLVSLIENSIIDFLAGYGVDSIARADAPGVYVGGDKIAALGLRVRKSSAFHGLSLNLNASKAHFSQINPCGYPGLRVVNLVDLLGEVCPSMDQAAYQLADVLAARLGYTAASLQPTSQYSGIACQ